MTMDRLQRGLRASITQAIDDKMPSGAIIHALVENIGWLVACQAADHQTAEAMIEIIRHQVDQHTVLSIRRLQDAKNSVSGRPQPRRRPPEDPVGA